MVETHGYQRSTVETFHGPPTVQRSTSLPVNSYKWLRTLLHVGDEVTDMKLVTMACERITELEGTSTTPPARDDVQRLGSEAEKPDKKRGRGRPPGSKTKRSPGNGKLSHSNAGRK